MPKQQPRLNRKVDHLIASANWYIDPAWGRMQLAKYLEDLEQASEHGLASLNYQARKQQSIARVLDSSGTEEALSSYSGKDGVAILQLNGVMQTEDGLSTRGIRSLVSEIQAAYEHPGIKGIVLDVNSGGGDVIAAGMLKSALTNAPKPVVVHAHLMASGALYATLPVKQVLAADQFSYVGSIGAVYSLDKELATWYKENVEDIYAASSSEKNQEWRAYLEGDPSKFAAKAEDIAKAFGAEVIKYRPLTPTQQEKALKGAMFMAEEGIALNLLTGYGTLRDAIGLVRGAQDSGSSLSFTNQHPVMFKTLVQQINRLFATTLDENASVEQIAEALAGQTSVSELSASVAKLTSQVSALATLESRLATLEGRADLSERVTATETAQAGLQQTLSTVQDTLTRHAASLTAVEEAIAGKATADKRPGGSATPGSALTEFAEKLELATAQGDSKY